MVTVQNFKSGLLKLLHVSEELNYTCSQPSLSQNFLKMCVVLELVCIFCTKLFEALQKGSPTWMGG